MSSDTPALNADGTYKDAKDIEFSHSRDNSPCLEVEPRPAALSLPTKIPGDEEGTLPRRGERKRDTDRYEQIIAIERGKGASTSKRKHDSENEGETGPTKKTAKTNQAVSIDSSQPASPSSRHDGIGYYEEDRTRDWMDLDEGHIEQHAAVNADEHADDDQRLERHAERDEESRKAAKKKRSESGLDVLTVFTMGYDELAEGSSATRGARYFDCLTCL
jgi:hypothetical protein